MKQTSTFLAALLLLTLLSPILMATQDRPEGQLHGKSSLTLIGSEQPVVLDGRLDEESWGKANVVRTFAQRDPDEGMPATEKTEVRALYDEENLYFGVQCFDSYAEGILATELRRDNDFINDDSFAVILDTFHDHRNAFLFRINPRGTQYDALITEEGRDVNVSWDEIWEVETRIDEDGWSAEIQIPLKSIRFSSSSGENTTFGVDFERIIRRKNEFTYWNNFSRDFNFHEVSQAGHLLGVAETGNNLRVRIKPYISTRINTRGAAERNTSFLGDVGLEDLKYSLTSGLTLDVTLNTDFAETEVDDQIINFNRVPIFFPEKREFFLEGAGIFEFGLWRGEGRPQINLYHSRRIGLSENGEEIPMLGGVKVAGKIGDKFTLAFLEAQTDDFRDKAGDNFAVFRLKRDFLSRSSLGFFFTNRQAEGGDFNRVVGIDQNLIFFDHLGITGMLGRSFTDGVTDDQLIGAVAVAWQDDLIDTIFDYTVQKENFESDLGFLERPGTRKLASLISISPRPNSDTIRQLYFAYRLEDFQRVEDHQLETRVQHLNYSTFFQDGSAIRFRPHYKTENLMEELRLPGGLTVPPGRYTWWYYWGTYSLNPARKLSGDFSYRYEKDYYGEGGVRQTWDLQPVIKLSSRFSADINYSINRIKLPEGEPVTFHQVNNRLNFAFSRKWLTSTLIQYNSASDLIGVNFRLNYIYRPGDDLFIVFNTFSDRSDSPAEVDRSLTIKFTHSFDF
ncbi:carbohydrate binding family 9 domain-containing protein [Acidobacteria bacterium AH-259-D05]|nr:carbohydrate binding family 9 domain-containing protein [Acidobacteria bacterium AH-259-D05]